MSKRVAEIVLLAEDFRQINFLRHYLIAKGHERRKIRVCPPPNGRGSGEQHVRNNYSNEVLYYRNRSARRSAALIVAIDADTETVLHHHQQLAGCLTGANQNDRTPKESIVLLVPKRNIETWILCLSGKIVDGRIVDETTDYKKASEIERQLRPAAVTLAEWSRPSASIPEYCVPSLRNGLTELKRIT